MTATIDVDFPILKPLDKATEDSLAPVQLRKDQDFLWVTTTDDGEDFYCIAFKGMSRERWKKLPPSIQKEKREEYARNVGRHHKMMSGDTVYREGTYVTSGVRQWFNRIPERKYLDVRGTHDQSLVNRWEVSGTDISALMLQHAWPDSNIGFSDSAKVLYDYLLQRFYGQNLRASLQAKFKLEKFVPTAPADFCDKEGFELADYQRFAMQLSLGSDLALFAEQGTGKTPIVIARINLEAKRARAGLMINPVNGKKEPFMYRAILAVPKAVRKNWQKEFKKFSTIAGKVTILKGQSIRRVKLLTRALKSEEQFAFSVAVVSYDTCANDIDLLKQIPWNLAVCDESHMFKNPDSKRWKKGLRVLREAAECHMVLTGTPMANGLFDLWTQLEFLGPGLSGFKKFKAFREFHGRFEMRGDGGGGAVRKLIGVKNIALLQERLTRLAFCITKKEAGLNLPDKVSDTWGIEMTAKQQDVYDKLASQLAVEIDEGLSQGTMTIDHVLTKLLRLAQVTSGHAKLDPIIDLDTGEIIKEGELINIASPNPKIEACLEMLAEKEPQAKTIFWCTFIQDIVDLEKALKAAGYDGVSYYGATTETNREIAVERFNNDDSCRFFIGNPKAAGMGLNLLGYEPGDDTAETYCDLVVFYSVNWSMLERSQAEDRAHRRGTKMPVTIRDLVAEDTIDEEMRDRVDDKRTRAEVIQDVRGMLKRVLDVDLKDLVDHV